MGLFWQVNATKRPKNSALEVDLDWERNAKPPPVITEEVSQSIEELILKRISEVKLMFFPLWSEIFGSLPFDKQHLCCIVDRDTSTMYKRLLVYLLKHQGK